MGSFYKKHQAYQQFRLLSNEQSKWLERTDPYWMDMQDQCAYVLKSIQANIEPNQVFRSKFRGDQFSFNIVMEFLVNEGYVAKDDLGKWIVKKAPKWKHTK